jgi:SAM-dependent methyltransferase
MSLFGKLSGRRKPAHESKEAAELAFWQDEIVRYQDWYDGKLAAHFGHVSPTADQKVKVASHKDSAILTWLNVHQKTKYLFDLQLSADAFRGGKLLDIGAGPMPSATAFEGCELYSLDPLLGSYVNAGFPLHYYERARFVSACSEDMPFEDRFFDAVIAVNSIDHVNDIVKTSAEMRRVLKANGKLALHIHYHKPTQEEPIEFNDTSVRQLFGWCGGLKKIAELQSKFGYTAPEDQSYALWRNF